MTHQTNNLDLSRQQNQQQKPAPEARRAGEGNSGGTGYVCKRCGQASPVGIGYVVQGWRGAADESITACGCGYSVKPWEKPAKQLQRGDVVMVGTMRNPDAKKRRTVLEAHTVFGLSVRVRFIDGTERAFADDDQIELVGSGELPALTEDERRKLWRDIYCREHSDYKAKLADGSESLMSWAQFGGGLVTLASVTDVELRVRSTISVGDR